MSTQPQKWKQYGGMNKLESYNNITVNTIVADTFTLKKAYYGTFDICGELHVSNNATVDANIKGNNLTITNDITANRLFIKENSTHYANMDVSGNLTVYNGNVYFHNNLDVSSNLYLRKQLFLGNSNISFINATDVIGKIGINTTTPISAFDISSNQSFVINVSSSQDTNYSILAQNKNHRGIQLQTDSSSSAINFFNSSSINGYIQYYNPGVFTLSTANNTNIWSTMSITNRATNGPLVSDHIFGETVVIYDISNATPYLYPVYENASETSGDALTLVSNNSVSNTFMNIVTPSKNGLSIGGGTYAKDPTRSMGTVGIMDLSCQYTPALNIVSGSSKIKHKSTVSIHNHCPETETYSLDVNGPIHVKNGELTITQQPTFEIIQLKTCRSNNRFGIAVGTPYRKDITSNSGINVTYYRQQILYTYDGGENWNTNIDLSGQSIETTSYVNNNMNAVYVYDSSLAFISGFNGFTSYTYNKGANWISIAMRYFNSFVKTVFVSNALRIFLGYDDGSVYWFDASANIYTGGLQSSKSIKDGSFNVPTNAPVVSMDGSGNTLYVVTNNTIYTYSMNSGAASPSAVSSRLCTITSNYTNISVLDSTHAIVVGASAITYINGGAWTDIPAPYSLNSVYVYDTSNAMAVGQNGVFMYSIGYSTWTVVPAVLLNSGGNAARLIDTKHLTNICMFNLNEFIITKTVTSYVKNTPSVAGNTSVFNGYFPDLYNNVTNYVMDISGSLRISGDININDEGKLNTNNSTFYLLNTGVKNIFLGGDASIIMGNAASTVTANYNLTVLHDASTNGNVLVGGNVLCNTVIKATNYEGIDACGNIFIGGLTPISNRNIKIGNFNNSVSSVNNILIGSINDNVYLGGTTSSSTVTANYNLTVLHDASTNGNVLVGGNVLCNTVIKATNYEGIDACGNIFIGGLNTISGNRNINIGNFSTTVNTYNIIKVGGSQDQVIIGGSVTSSISLKTGPILYLNYTSLPNSSAGPGNQASGIHIGDNGSLDAGYIVVSYDRAGYVIKSPASNNVVKLDISGLLLPTATSKIVSLRPPDVSEIDSSYVIGVTSIDVSNVFLKNYVKSNAVQQVVDTSMGVLGTVSIGKYTSLISNTQLDVSGNTISSRLGLGTSAVNASYVLDISGGTHISGNVSQDSGYIWQF